MATPAHTRRETSTLVEETTAAQLVNELLGTGLRSEELALAFDVSNTTVLRWKSGSTTPHAGTLRRIRTYHAQKVRSK